MTKESRLSLIRARWSSRRRFITSTLALAAVSLDTAEDTSTGKRDAQRRITNTLRERLPSMDDSIADSDKIEATVSRLEFDSATDGHGMSDRGGYLLTRAERMQLAREMAPRRAFLTAVRNAPLLLTA